MAEQTLSKTATSLLMKFIGDKKCELPPSQIKALVYRCGCGDNCWKPFGCGTTWNLPEISIEEIEIPDGNDCSTENTALNYANMVPGSRVETDEWSNDEIVWDCELYDEMRDSQRNREVDAYVIQLIGGDKVKTYVFHAWVKTIGGEFPGQLENDYAKLPITWMLVPSQHPKTGETDFIHALHGETVAPICK